MSIEQDTSPQALILPLNAAEATLEQVGGKGASLAQMAAAGLPVPPGFSITTTAYRRFVSQNELQERILAAVSVINIEEPATLDKASQQIEKLFIDASIPDDVAETIRRAYSELAAGKIQGDEELAVAVRSSATAEDLPEMSFAGQQETYLNIIGAYRVLEAVKRCWASLWTARAIGYRAQHGIAPEDVSLAVVVQELVAADISGILFTANPLTGGRDQVMINAAWGLGEAIVGGQVTPDTVVVEKASRKILSQEIAEKRVMTVRTSSGTREEPVPAEKRAAAALTPEQAAELARVGVRIEQAYHRPMDIEWAIQDGQIFVVQARPITALPEPVSTSPMTGEVEWELPKAKGKYMRGSVLELLPDPLSPLFATLGLPAWSKSLEDLLNSTDMKNVFSDNMLVVINGYGYYDVTLSLAQTAKLLLVMPRVLAVELPRLLRSSQTRWQEARNRYTQITKSWQARDLTGTTATDLLNGIKTIVNEAADYYLSVQSGFLPAAYMSESLFTLVYNRLLKPRHGPPALTFVLGYDSAPIQAEKSLYDLARWIREQPELSARLSGMSSSEFTAAYQSERIEGIDEPIWSEFRKRFAAHLAKFGHTIYDLDFAQPVPADDPSALLETLKFFLSGEATNPYTRQETTAAAREQAVQTTLQQLHGVRRSLFRRLLGWAQRYAPLREDALADVGLGWPILRQMLHEIGRRLSEKGAIETPNDIFWLTLDYLQTATIALDAGQKLDDYHHTVTERRATWESERAVTPPTALPLKGGARFLGFDISAFLPARTDQQAGDIIKGIGASPGRVEGPARVISGPNEFGQMKRGDILVAKITTPAWTPLFALAAGIVTDVGGPLSHSSIVAREYHIPAVLGTGVATERLHSDQQITVDGSAGTVTIANER